MLAKKSKTNQENTNIKMTEMQAKMGKNATKSVHVVVVGGGVKQKRQKLKKSMHTNG